MRPTKPAVRRGTRIGSKRMAGPPTSTRVPGGTSPFTVARARASAGPAARRVPVETSPMPRSRGVGLHTTSTRLPTSSSGANESASSATTRRGPLSSPTSTERSSSLSRRGTRAAETTRPTRRSMWAKVSGATLSATRRREREHHRGDPRGAGERGVLEQRRRQRGGRHALRQRALIFVVGRAGGSRRGRHRRAAGARGAASAQARRTERAAGSGGDPQRARTRRSLAGVARPSAGRSASPETRTSVEGALEHLVDHRRVGAARPSASSSGRRRSRAG